MGLLTVKQSIFQVTYRLDGLVSASAAVAVDVPNGTQLDPSSLAGEVVSEGQTLGVLSSKLTDGDRETKGTVAQSRRSLAMERVGPVTAPVSGRARVSPTAARVESVGLDVVVPLKPLQELRYRGMQFSGVATVETVLGQRRSPCVAVWIELAPQTPGSAGGEDSSTSAVHCRLGADLETAAGLPAVLTLTSKRQDDVVSIPLSYVGLDETGDNYVARVRQGNSFVERPVVVGSTDGVRRVITEGLIAGDVVEPIPAS